MRKHRRQRALLSLLATLSLLPFSQLSHSSDSERWFQIEVIVFSRLNGDSGEEHWPRDPNYLLPSSERELNRYANALGRHSGHRVLFHEAWRQPFRDNREAPPVIITGGDAYGSHFELEGSIRVTLSRYLHLNTNLWLTRFDPNTGQTPGTWPQLPNRPTRYSVDVPAQIDAPLSSPFENPERNAWGLDLRTDTTTANLPEFLREPYLPSRIVTMNQ